MATIQTVTKYLNRFQPQHAEETLNNMRNSFKDPQTLDVVLKDMTGRRAYEMFYLYYSADGVER